MSVDTVQTSDRTGDNRKIRVDREIQPPVRKDAGAGRGEAAATRTLSVDRSRRPVGEIWLTIGLTLRPTDPDITVFQVK
ncbi:MULTISPECIES: hypothetical protein [Actinomadura]|uniref:hypothetical protein n=1 Tax=Actinomadura TaxID=1988 RepID=UPI002610C522|nr:hypothetical protein [Actinomadura geliboluensis]